MRAAVSMFRFRLACCRVLARHSRPESQAGLPKKRNHAPGSQQVRDTSPIFWTVERLVKIACARRKRGEWLRREGWKGASGSRQVWKRQGRQRQRQFKRRSREIQGFDEVCPMQSCGPPQRQLHRKSSAKGAVGEDTRAASAHRRRTWTDRRRRPCLRWWGIPEMMPWGRRRLRGTAAKALPREYNRGHSRRRSGRGILSRAAYPCALTRCGRKSGNEGKHCCTLREKPHGRQAVCTQS